MVTIRVKDHVSNFSTYKDGEVIYRLLHPHIKDDQPATVSFEGILSLPSAFINAALVKLLEDIPLEQVKKNLRVIKSTRQINALIKQRFAFAATHGLADDSQMPSSHVSE
jgi:hypothetical protein